MSLTTNAITMLKERLANPGDRNEMQLMESVLRIAGMWRSKALANTFLAREGSAVLNGPFAGMHYTGSTEGALLPRLIGCYESELHPHLAAVAAEGLDQIVDVGCAEGYYAVGLARMLPAVVVHAHDVDPAAVRACAIMAAANGVQDRVKVGGLFGPDDFEAFAGTKTLVFMDIEGAERALLDPVRSPALRTLKIIVETHGGDPLCNQITERFADSHEIIRVDQAGKTTPLPKWLQDLSHMDQILAGWEWRLGPTPWLVMRPNGPSAWS
jgi:hypothetical protein